MGSLKQKVLIEGDQNFLKKNEILITKDEGYTLLRERVDGKLQTYVVVPLEEFNPKEE